MSRKKIKSTAKLKFVLRSGLQYVFQDFGFDYWNTIIISDFGSKGPHHYIYFFILVPLTMIVPLDVQGERLIL